MKLQMQRNLARSSRTFWLLWSGKQSSSTGGPRLKGPLLDVTSSATPHLANCKRFFSPTTVQTVRIIYVESDGKERVAEAKIGENLMDVAHENNIDLEGACGGELACSTCHLIFDKETYDSLPPMTEDEQDMLDLAFEVTETSRLGCQIKVTEAFEGVTVKIPDDGFS